MTFLFFRGQSGVYCGATPFTANWCPCDLILANQTKRSSLSFKGNGRVTRAALISEGRDNFVSKQVGETSGIRTQPGEIELAFGTLAAETIPTTTTTTTTTTTASGFFSNDEYDLDRPTAGFSSVPEAVEDIRKGKVSTMEMQYLCLLLGTIR